ncbi:anaerobic selenocysteine-containing dehydrogenase [Zhongshania antarctica]|uniref:Anaerobic selenocysteine-containing dehydrogenase n=1 Tax=Zhongshania antarctica TaxID=641702 RepID=A0A840R7Y4_9GAMM|nr:molybdopterin-dependent oxidoreductase [Zhongshania antarctica]MBB5188724.1 anaerobic selenocysteine-containing dehydrogenase [Zhongshania antarctica]
MPAPVPFDPSAIANAKHKLRPAKDGVTVKRTICATCDIACSVVTESKQGRVVKVRSSDNPIFRDNICMKGIIAPKAFAHPDRILHPMKRVGERGSGKWERVSWDEAMRDIGQRLKKVIDEHGPEAWAVSTSQWNTATDHGLGRRIMNHIGSPNWISGVALCAGNTAAINRLTYGWFPMGDFNNTNCIVLMGHNPRRHSWTPLYNYIRSAQQRGAKLIVCDPRKSSSAERADIWLPLKAGSDAAMMFGWLKVIFDEGLYDKDFVANWTVGFEELRKRVDEFPLDRVAKLTGCEPEMIAKAARMYANSGPSIIPWTPITDMQRNSTSAIRLQGILRAVCGYIDVAGGETLQGFHPDVVPESTIEMHEVLSEAQKAKQLGSDTHPAFTYRGQEALREPLKRVWGHEYPNQITGCYMANPSATFRAMAGEGSYPVKAFFTLGNNTVMSYANMPLIIKAMMNQDLIVAHEHHMTPTAQLADYVLPGDSWLERPWLTDAFGWMSAYRPSEQSMEPPGEALSTWEFWKRIANALDRPELVSWASLTDFYDDRLKATGMSFKELSETTEIYFDMPEFRKYLKTGFATPSGKVELKSSILEDLGFDPLPYFREDPPVDPNYPLQMFTGVREDGYFQTAQRQVPEMRQRAPEPMIFVSPDTAKDYQLQENEWVIIENQTGKISAQVAIKEAMPNGLVRVPHGWWKPEMQSGAGHLSGALQYSDAQLCRDDEDYLDREQGIPHLKGVPCRIVKDPTGGAANPAPTEATL